MVASQRLGSSDVEPQYQGPATLTLDSSNQSVSGGATIYTEGPIICLASMQGPHLNIQYLRFRWKGSIGRNWM